MKKQPLKWEETSANHAADKWVCIQNLLYEEFLELNKKKKKIKQWAKDLNKHFSKEDTQMANSKKQRSMSLIIQEIQSQEIMASHTLGRFLSKREKITRVGENVEKLEPLWTVGGKIQ